MVFLPKIIKFPEEKLINKGKSREEKAEQNANGGDERTFNQKHVQVKTKTPTNYISKM